MLVDKSKLEEILKFVDQHLTKKAILVAIGGTALTLLDLKKASYDIDLMMENNDPVLKADITVLIYRAGAETQIQDKGVIIVHPLPPNYLNKYIFDKKLNSKFQNLSLYIMDPIDLIVTKIHRYDDKDVQDIASILLIIKPKFEDIEKRFNEFISLYKGKKDDILQKFELFRKQYVSLK